MMEQIASEVHELRSSKPLRPFKDAPIKVALIGNCSVNKMSLLLKTQRGVDTLFSSNLSNWSNYHRDSFLERAEEADVVIGMATATNKHLFHTPDQLREAFGDKCLFLPLIWLDGTDTLQAFSIAGNLRYFGGDPIVERAEEVGFDEVYEELIRGKLNTNPSARFAASIEKLRKAETGGIQISDYVLDVYQGQSVANAIGHPANIVIRELFCRLADKMDMKINRESLFTPSMMGRLTLPAARRMFTPYDVEELGLQYPYDPRWMLQAKTMISLIKNKVTSGSYQSTVDIGKEDQ